MDEQLRDHLTGRCFEVAGVTEKLRAEIIELLERKRSIDLKRVDGGDATPDDPTYHTVTYAEVSTLHTLHKHCGLPSYSGQMKVYKYIDGDESTELTVTLNSEDQYFDFLVSNFYRADFTSASGSTSPFTVTVLSETRAMSAVGRYF
jgi:hypothetical protein